MTLPRQVIPGRTYLVTRRCRDRRFLLRPDAMVNEIFRYCIARAAEKSGVAIHAAVVLSNHFHIVLTDVHGTLPIFCHSLGRFTASALNAWRGRTGSVYEGSEKVSVVWLASEEAIIDKLAYVFANPVSAALVDDYRRWPGFGTRIEHLRGHTDTTRRPDVYFRALRHADTCNLEVSAPSTFRGREGLLIRAVSQRVKETTHRLLQQVRQAGRRVLGVPSVLGTSWLATPVEEADRGLVRPTFAAVTEQAIRACQAARREFYTAYYAALDAWRNHARDVVFPCGTWWMTRFAGVAQATQT